MEIPEVDLDEFKKIKEIGRGSYGKVSLVSKFKDFYAAKEYETSFKNKDSDFFRELITYSKVDNPATLNIIGYSTKNFSKKPYPTLILDYMKRGSLDKVLHKDVNIKLSRPQKFLILLGIALGMKNLHSKGIIHRDLKPGNVLLDENFCPKICDFGCSIISDIDLTKFQMEDITGTLIYMAPEICSENKYTYKVDVYSFALIFYETLTENIPFSDYKSKYKLMKDKKNGKEVDLSLIDDCIICNFIKKCLSSDPNKRYNFSQIVYLMMTHYFVKYFNISNELLFSYLDLFENDLKDKDLKGELDFDNEILYGNFDVIRYMACKLYFGIGVKQDLEKAAHYFHIVSQRGDNNSMFIYARMLQKGQGVKMDKDLAIKLYKKAALCGDETSIYNYAHMLLQGENIEKNIEKAAKYLKIGFHLMDDQCASLYSYLLLNELCTYNPEEAQLCFLMNTFKSNAHMLYNYADFLLKKNNLEKAVECLKKAADAEFMDGMIKYAYFLWNGIGCKQNKRKAEKYLKRAIDKGNNKLVKVYGLVKSQNNEIQFDNNVIFDQFLIVFREEKDYINFNSGQCIAIDDWKIINFIHLCRQVEIAADNGNIDAMFYYGKFILLGYGKRNIKESHTYFKLASEKGNTDGMIEYAYVLLLNKDERGIELMKKAADNGNINAMNIYAHMRYTGDKMEVDKKEAAKYFKLAADYEIPENNKESFCLFQNIVEKIADLRPILENSNVKGDDESYHSYLVSKYRSIKMYLQMLYNRDSVSYDKNEANKYYLKLHEYANNMLNRKKYLEIKFNELKRKVQNGDLKAMHKYSLMLLNGDGVKIDIKEGFKYLKMSADRGNSESMLQYATMLFKGEKIDVDKKESIKYFKKLADQGNIDALKIFYNLVIKRKEIEFDITYKVKCIQKLAEIGNDDAMYEYGCMLKDNDIRKAAKYFKKSADKGNIPSMFNYGLMLYNGDGIEQNKKEGLRYIVLSADSKDPDAMLFLGKYIINENGFKIDKKEVAHYLQMSLNQEDFFGINKYGYASQNGKEFKFTLEDGINFIISSAIDRNAEAMYLYGIYLYSGKYVEMNKNKGIEYIKRSAYKGNLKAMYQYGKMLFDGIDVPIDIDEGINLLKESADQGNDESMYLYGRIKIYGYKIDINREEGIKYMKMAIDKENSDAMFEYGHLLFGEGDEEEGALYFEKAIEKGNTDAMLFYGISLLEKNHEKGIQLIKKSAENGNKMANYEYGELLISENNILDGFDYIKTAADDGNTNALYMVGKILYNTNENNQEEIIKYVKAAADKGHIDAISFLYSLLLNISLDKKDENIQKKSIKYLKILADKEIDYYIFEYALCLLSKNDLREAIKYFKLSVEKGNILSMTRYGIMLYNGEGTEKDKEEGFHYIETAAKKGEINASIIMQTLFANENNIFEYDQINIHECFKKAADQGDVYSMAQYGKMAYLGNEIPKDYTEAFKYYKMAAEKDDIMAMFNISIMLEEGYGVNIDKKESIKYLKMSADKGFPDAILKYGFILLNGIEIEKNIKEAIKYFKILADEGDIKSMFIYGVNALNEPEISKEEALSYITIAAKKGYSNAINMMQILYLEGNLIEMDKKKAAHYFKIAEELGNIESCYRYGLMLFNGDGIEKDKKEGIKYIKKATDNGNIKAMKTIRTILYFDDEIGIYKKEAKKFFNMMFDNRNDMSSCTFKTIQNKEIEMKEINGIIKKENKDKNIEEEEEEEENYEKEAQIMKIEADAGVSNSMLRYGIMLYKGQGVQINKKEAARYLKMAADLMVVNAMHFYALMLYKGDGIDMNKKEAANYFKMAADLKYCESSYFYANMLSEGDGIEVNKVEAEKYYKMSYEY